MVAAGASGAGMIAATLSHPLDTIKTCMQGDLERKVLQSRAFDAALALALAP